MSPLPATILGMLLSLFAIGSAAAGEAEILGRLSRDKVTLTVSLERGDGAAAVLVGRFQPELLPPGLHLYDLATSSTAQGAGYPTLLELDPAGEARVAGPVTADRPAQPLAMGGIGYPPGPVTLRLPITLPANADGTPVLVRILASWMACTDRQCFMPVIRAPLAVTLPAVRGTPAQPPAATPGIDPALLRAAVSDAVAAEFSRQRMDAGGIRFRHPTSVAEAQALIDEAHAAGKAAILDFTGPSCSNCQLMAKTILRLPVVVAAWNRMVPIEIDTDRHGDLAAWQQERFQDQARPLYVRIEPPVAGHGIDWMGAPRWAQSFAVGDTATLDAFMGFLAGGAGVGAGTGDGLWQFIALALLGGLFTLVMPCTYPMVPFTLNFFAKQAVGGRSTVPLAAFYALGIIVCFVGIGVLVTGVFGASLGRFAGHWLTNLGVALLFALMGLSLLGVFFLRLPAGLEDRLGGARSGYLGALVMGLAFAVTAFTCTAPFAGAVLAQAVAGGGWGRAALGMAVYSSAIAVPFFVLALVPGALRSMPKAGAWMNEVKVVGGVIELAAAMKFLVITDLAFGLGVIARTSTLACWSAASLFIAAYLAGLVRWKDDAPIAHLAPIRGLAVLAFLALGLWFAAGLFGRNLGVVEAWFPGDAVP